jgi:tetratricopeptide (TPR) repeat protein
MIVIILGILLHLTRKQVENWKNDLTLGDHALSVTSNNYRAFDLKGNYFLAQGNYDSAKENYSNSLTICKVSTFPRMQIGWILLQQARYVEAIKYFGEVLDKDSTNVMANSNCAAAMSMLKDFRNARSFYLRALDKNPAYVPALYNLGLDYEELQDYSSAEYYFSRVLRYKPGHFAAISQLDKCKMLASKLRK